MGSEVELTSSSQNYISNFKLTANEGFLSLFSLDDMQSKGERT